MLNKIYRSICVVLAITIILSASMALSLDTQARASTPQDIVLVPAGQPIQVAFASWLDADVPFQDYIDAFEMAVSDYGSIKGFSVQRNDFNSGCTFETGQAAGDLVTANAQNLGVIGPYCSSSTLGMAPILQAEEVVMISYANTYPGLSGNGWSIFNRVVVVDPEYTGWNTYISLLPSVITWSDAFDLKYGRQPSEQSKYTYDATMLLLTRIDEVSTLDGANNLLVDRADLAAEVRNTASFTGVTGDISMEPDGDRVNSLLSDILVPAGDPIQVALATWLDPGFPYQDYLDAFDMAVQAYGPIKGFTIQRNDFDAGCGPDTGQAAGMQVITNTQNVGVIGPLCSGSTRGMAPLLQAADVVMISYSNTAPDLGFNGWTIFNRMVVHDSEFNIWDLRVSKLPSVLSWNDEFSTAFGRQPSSFSKYVYDSTILLLMRIDEVSTLDGSNNLIIDRSDLAAVVRHTTSIPGVTGIITLEPNGDRLNLLPSILMPLVSK